MTTTNTIDHVQIPSDWNKLFPKQIDPPPSGEFELGLVLGGTVSAGAYTAGVIDFLIEALDTWIESRSKNPEDRSIPGWQTRIQAISGTSGGGVIAALLGRALAFKFPHVRKGSTEADRHANPLYRVWVEQLDIAKMLDCGDLSGGKSLLSLLNPKPLEDSKDMIAAYELSFPASARITRNYIPQPLPIHLTLTNLRGIPYRLEMGDGLSQSYVDHADFVRMAVFTQGGNQPVRPDEFGVSDNPATNGFLSWNNYAEFALGTSAFPLGFPLRPLARPMIHLAYRPIVVQGDAPTDTQVIPLQVNWTAIGSSNDQMPPGEYHFLTADGGMTDNEPIELCRKAVAGWVGRNPRDGKLAHRAVLLVDPFADSPSLGPEVRTSLGSAVGSLIGTWKDQARYDSRDITLATDEECFSRFMITARRRGAEVGGKSIASASVFAFGGFLNEAFRRHDFLLGRFNCQQYLREKLVLPAENPLFSAWKQQATAAQLAEWVVMDGDIPSLPLIPLLGDCRTDEMTDAYPAGVFDVNDRPFQDLLKVRIETVLDRAKKDIEPGGLKGMLTDLYLSFGVFFGKGDLQDKATEYIEGSLKDWHL